VQARSHNPKVFHTSGILMVWCCSFSIIRSILYQSLNMRLTLLSFRRKRSCEDGLREKSPLAAEIGQPHKNLRFPDADKNVPFLEFYKQMRNKVNRRH
jgi:hypothetical protein